MQHRVVFSPEAAAELFDLYDYIARQAGPAVAFGYIHRIETYCSDFDFQLNGAPNGMI